MDRDDHGDSYQNLLEVATIGATIHVKSPALRGSLPLFAPISRPPAHDTKSPVYDSPSNFFINSHNTSFLK